MYGFGEFEHRPQVGEAAAAHHLADRLAAAEALNTTDAAVGIQNRITSYNVCYTKLLRSAANDDTMARVASSARNSLARSVIKAKSVTPRL